MPSGAAMKPNPLRHELLDGASVHVIAPSSRTQLLTGAGSVREAGTGTFADLSRWRMAPCYPFSRPLDHSPEGLVAMVSLRLPACCTATANSLYLPCVSYVSVAFPHVTALTVASSRRHNIGGSQSLRRCAGMRTGSTSPAAPGPAKELESATGRGGNQPLRKLRGRWVPWL